jgi:hypothetical protein
MRVYRKVSLPIGMGFIVVRARRGGLVSLLVAAVVATTTLGCANVFSDAASVVNNRRVLQEPYLLATAAAGDTIGSSQVVPLGGGTALVLWQQTVAGQIELFAQEVDRNSPRGTPVNLSEAIASDITFFEAAGDGDGNIALIYGPGPSNEVYVTRYDHTGDRVPRTDIVNPGASGPLGFGSVAVDGAGRVLAIFVQEVGTYGTYACAYAAESGWCTAPEEIDLGADDVSIGVNPEVVATANGQFHVAWAQGVSPSQFVYARTYEAGTDSWGPEVPLGDQSPPSRRGIELITAGGGRVYAVWSGDIRGFGFTELGVATYAPESGWFSIETPVSDLFATNQWIVGDSQGGTVSIGYLQDDGGAARLSLLRGTTGNWSGPIQIADAPTAAANEFDLVIDSQDGTAIVRRENLSAIDEILLTRYSPVSGPGRNLVVDPTAGSVPPASPGMAVTGDGTVFASFAAEDGGNQALYVSTITLE